MSRKRPTPILFLAISPGMVATCCDVSERTVYAAIEKGQLGPVYQIGLKRRILVSDCENWIRTHWKKATPRKRSPHAKSV